MSSCRASRLVALAHAALAVGCATPPLMPRAPTPGVPHFSIETYNVLFRNPDDPDTLEAMGRADADIVCLQEVSYGWVDSIAAHFEEVYPHMLFHAEEGAGGYAVLSRFPLVDSSVETAPHHDGWHVLAATPMGVIEILVVHLRAHFTGGGGPIRAYLRVDSDHQTDIVNFTNACSGELPMIVVGDFNEENGGGAVQYLETRGMEDVLPLFHPAQPTYRHERALAAQLEATIDHIFFDRSFAPLNAYVVDGGGSDHFPVVAHFEPAR